MAKKNSRCFFENVLLIPTSVFFFFRKKPPGNLLIIISENGTVELGLAQLRHVKYNR